MAKASLVLLALLETIAVEDATDKSSRAKQDGTPSSHEVSTLWPTYGGGGVAAEPRLKRLRAAQDPQRSHALAATAQRAGLGRWMIFRWLTSLRSRTKAYVLGQTCLETRAKQRTQPNHLSEQRSGGLCVTTC